MKYAPLFLIIINSLALCGNAQPRVPPTVITFTINLPDSLKSSIRDAVTLFTATYGQIDSLSIGTDTITEPVQLADGGIETTEAYTVPGAIFINPTVKYTRMHMRNNMKHELFHAIASKLLRPLPPDSTYALLNDGFVVIGYHGLVIEVSNSERHITSGFRLIEEAAAEVCAMKLEPGYEVHSFTYYWLGSFLKDMVAAGWISTRDLISEQRDNDFLAFCGKILKKPRGAVTPDDVVFISGCFQQIHESNKNYRSVMTSVIEKRGEKGQYLITDPK